MNLASLGLQPKDEQGITKRCVITYETNLLEIEPKGNFRGGTKGGQAQEASVYEGFDAFFVGGVKS